LDAKQSVVKGEVREELCMLSKTMEIIEKLAKAYKAWTRTGQNAEFMAVHTSQMDFANAVPEITAPMPPCMKQDMLEMQFNADLKELLEAGDTAGMAKRTVTSGLFYGLSGTPGN